MSRRPHLRRIHLLQSKCYVGRDLRGTKLLRGENLTGFDFMDADLSGADLTGCHGSDVDFRCTNLSDANLARVNARGWQLTGAKLANANLQGSRWDSRCVLQGVDLSGAFLRDMVFRANGARCRGMMLPQEFDFGSIKRCYDNSQLMGRILMALASNDREVEAIALYGMTTGTVFNPTDTLPCWEGITQYAERHYPRRLDDVGRLFATVPATWAAQRWAFARAVVNAESLESLKRDPHARMFRKHLAFIAEHRWPQQQGTPGPKGKRSHITPRNFNG